MRSQEMIDWKCVNMQYAYKEYRPLANVQYEHHIYHNEVYGECNASGPAFESGFGFRSPIFFCIPATWQHHLYYSY